MRRLVVGLDGSVASEMALHWSLAIASATGAAITAALTDRLQIDFFRVVIHWLLPSLMMA